MTPSRLASGLLLATCLPLTGCDKLQDVIRNIDEGVSAPTSGLNRVDLVKAPSLNKLLRWSCYSYLGSAADTTCPLMGWNSKPARAEMLFSFDIVFDLYNANSGIPIPLVELLLGISVFEDQNLGALCVSFCDPEEEDCSSAGQNVEGACEIDDSVTEVDGVGDLVPTVDDLLDLATDIATGETENFEWRVIPSATVDSCEPAAAECTEESDEDGTGLMCCDGECTPYPHDECTLLDRNNGQTCQDCDGYAEAHIGFDFNIDTMLSLFESLLEEALDDVLASRPVDLTIPYQADGTLFFDVPSLGRYALGFGPYEDRWNLE